MTTSIVINDIQLVPTRRKRPEQLTFESVDGREFVKYKAKRVVAYRSSSDGRLLFWNEVPPTLQFNHYIASGYRCGLSYKQCMCSLFTLHNETGNVWSHLSAALVVGVVIWRALTMPEHPHLAAFLSVLIPQLVCLVLSTTYHLFMAQVKHYDVWLKLDICGIFSMMVIPFFTSVWWGYRCEPLWRAIALTAYCSCAGLAFLSATYARTSTARATPLFMLLLLRAGILMHRAQLGTCSRVSLLYYALMEIVGVIGATVNVARLPERWLHPVQSKHAPGPNKAQILDYFGHSHQIMHLCSVFMMWTVYMGILNESKHILTQPCPVL